MTHRTSPAIEPIVTQVHVPAGMLGPEPTAFEVRCFLVACRDGIVVVDVGPPGTIAAIEPALGRIGVGWPEVTDIVLTHAHFDHVGGLAEAFINAPHATLWAGARDVPAIHLEGDPALRPLFDGDRVRDLVVVETPGHTIGHISLLNEELSTMLVGDLVGSVEGSLSLGPAAFTADPVRARVSLERTADMGIDRLLFSHGAEVSDPNGAIRELLRET